MENFSQNTEIPVRQFTAKVTDDSAWINRRNQDQTMKDNDDVTVTLRDLKKL